MFIDVDNVVGYVAFVNSKESILTIVMIQFFLFHSPIIFILGKAMLILMGYSMKRINYQETWGKM
jgi:hypothetical protein